MKARNRILGRSPRLVRTAWTDEELVARSVNGDADSFNQLILRWERPIYALAYRTIGREEDARDIVQDTFLRAFRALPGLQGAGEILVVALSDRAEPVPRLDSAAAADADRRDARGRRSDRAGERAGAGRVDRGSGRAAGDERGRGGGDDASARGTAHGDRAEGISRADVPGDRGSAGVPAEHGEDAAYTRACRCCGGSSMDAVADRRESRQARRHHERNVPLRRQRDARRVSVRRSRRRPCDARSSGICARARRVRERDRRAADASASDLAVVAAARARARFQPSCRAVGADRGGAAAAALGRRCGRCRRGRRWRPRRAGHRRRRGDRQRASALRQRRSGGHDGLDAAAGGRAACRRPDARCRPSNEEWRPALVALEQSLRTETGADEAAAARRRRWPRGAAIRRDDAAVLRRVQAMVADSEQRQRRADWR